MSAAVRQPTTDRPQSANRTRPRSSGRKSQNKSGTKYSPRTINSNIIPLIGHAKDPAVNERRIPSPINKVGPAGKYVGGQKVYSNVVPFVGSMPKPSQIKAGHAPAVFAGGRRVVRRTSQKKKDGPESPTLASDASQSESEEKHASKRNREKNEKRHDNKERLEQKEQIRIMHDRCEENAKAFKNHLPASKTHIVQPRGANF